MRAVFAVGALMAPFWLVLQVAVLGTRTNRGRGWTDRAVARMGRVR
jgi:hypothetical protein